MNNRSHPFSRLSPLWPFVFWMKVFGDICAKYGKLRYFALTELTTNVLYHVLNAFERFYRFQSLLQPICVQEY